jgi:acyl-CoA synthetase (NDP forming)
MTHHLDSLLKPRSIAVIGATERPHSVGRRIVHNLLAGKYEGNIYPVNPGRDTVLGLPCYPDLASLPGTAEHVAFAVRDQHIEAAMDDAIAHGARASTIMSQLLLENDREPPLQQRIESRARESGMRVCGANGMGFYNCRDGVWMCGFDTRENHPRGGNVTLISHSGAGMSGIFDCEERIDFNLAVSTGQEINVAMPDYMDFAIDEHDTRVIGLFMETVRDPGAMIAVLEKASQRRIPVVAIKVGKTALSARLAQSHSGAVAGEDAAYEALFERYGVQRVRDMDEFTTALIMFAQPHEIPGGGLVTLHDSGGERQLLIDLARDMKVPLAELSESTTSRLESLLDPGLPPVNPLDAWGAGGPDSNQIMTGCLSAMMEDRATAIGAVVLDRAPYGALYPEYVEYMREAHLVSGKPLFLVSNRQGTGADPAVVEVTREGLPVLDGLRSFLSGVSCLFRYRDYCQRHEPSPPVIAPELLEEISRALDAGQPGELAVLELLRKAGLPVLRAEAANNETAALDAANAIGYPVVMKTAESGIQHKTDQGGVALDLADGQAVAATYREMAGRLGPQVLLTPMIEVDGLEMLLGMVKDPQFGPLVIMGIGGVRVEALRDVVSTLPPFGADTAMRLLKGLEHSALLEYKRGGGLPDIAGFCEAAALFSALVASLGDVVEELEMNPIIVHAGGCVAVDALIITADHDGPTD